MPRPGGRPEGGLDGDELVGSCFNAFTKAMEGATGQPQAEWSALDESSQEAFASVTTHVRQVMEAQEEGQRYSLLAANCDFHYRRAAGEQPVEREQIPPARLLAWEAFCRHCCNMLMLDEEEDGSRADHEAHWLQWASDKAKAAQLPQHQADAQRPIEDQ